MRAGRRRRWPGPPSPFLHRPGEMLMPHASAGSGSCMRKESRMRRTALAALAAAALAGAGLLVPGTAAGAPARHGYEPVLNPADFVHSITNPYFPFPVGRTLIYRGVRDGVTQTDSVHVTSQTRVLEGITAVVVSDVATHNGKLLEKTTDYYAQDEQGNVWYLGERTAAFSGGQVDHSGSWLAGVHDGEPGIVMKANPQIPNAYRQEFLAGQAEDTAWIVNRGGSTKVPYGPLKKVLSTLEATRLEPGAYDLKVYAPGIGIAREQALTGTPEFAELVSVTG